MYYNSTLSYMILPFQAYRENFAAAPLAACKKCVFRILVDGYTHLGKYLFKQKA